MSDDRGSFSAVRTRVPSFRPAPRRADLERAVRALSEAEARQRLLAETGAVLGASTEGGPAVLDGIVRVVARPEFASYCVADLVEGARVRRRAIAHAEPGLADVARQLLGFPPQPGDLGIGVALTEGRPVLLDRVDDTMLERVTLGPEHRAVIQRLDPRSAAIAPLVARGRVLGSISAFRRGGEPPFAPPDLDLLAEVAGRAGLALDNARLLAEAQLAVEERERVIGIVSHDLRAPLNTIAIACALLERDPDDTARRERQIERIRASVTGMTRLIEDLLDASRLVAGRLALEVGVFELRRLVDEAIDQASGAGDPQGVTFVHEIPEDLPAALGDRERVRQVLQNLLENAVRFSPRGGRVAVRARVEGPDLRIGVSDQGPGVLPDEAPLLFTQFWQGRGRGRQGGGSGLGLAIVKGIVEAHGGAVGVESDPGHGATFWFTLRAAG